MQRRGGWTWAYRGTTRWWWVRNLDARSRKSVTLRSCMHVDVNRTGGEREGGKVRVGICNWNREASLSSGNLAFLHSGDLHLLPRSIAIDIFLLVYISCIYILMYRILHLFPDAWYINRTDMFLFYIVYIYCIYVCSIYTICCIINYIVFAVESKILKYWRGRNI